MNTHVREVFMTQRQMEIFHNAKMFPIGSKVKLRNPDIAEENEVFVVVGITVEYQEDRRDFGENYWIATEDEISRQHGCVDGFSAKELIKA